MIVLYLAAIVAANGLVTAYGQPALVFTAFLLIPFDLVVRDLLQDRYQRCGPWGLRLRMGALILGGSAVSYVTTVGSLRIATASFVAFTVTGLLDAVTYQAMLRKGRLFRINAATVLGAFTDSAVFALIAFDHAELWLVVSQAASKSIGGFFWGLVMLPLFQRRSHVAG